MSKLDDYEFRRLPQELIDFKDDVRDLINNGKYQVAISSGTPTYSANSGELAVTFANGSGTLYIHSGTGFTDIVSFPL